ncbi:hypothetical protein BJY04DRAFT_19358 [Aspergillus karnatakaensis]|uniref:uncharacterized protein n=1 Tax=Aspergillus karnatakaensis TaxID=1810916 RepID=UPI003CCD1B09
MVWLLGIHQTTSRNLKIGNQGSTPMPWLCVRLSPFWAGFSLAASQARAGVRTREVDRISAHKRGDSVPHTAILSVYEDIASEHGEECR